MSADNNSGLVGLRASNAAPMVVNANGATGSIAAHVSVQSRQGQPATGVMLTSDGTGPAALTINHTGQGTGMVIEVK